MANRITQLDHMTRGRIMFGAGPGLLASDALMMGIEPEATRERMAEALGVILRLFAGETVTETTSWYTLRDGRTHLRPYSHPHPEVCVASAVTPSGGRLAGRYGLGMLCVAAGERAGFDALDINWKIACEIAAEHGRVMDRSRLRCVLNMHLAVIPHFSAANGARRASYDWVTANQDELVEKRVNAANQMFAKHEAERAGKSGERPDSVQSTTLS